MPSSGPSLQPEQTGPCIARQPVLTASEEVLGYELFFRASQHDPHFQSDEESATSAAIETLSLMGHGVLCDDRLAFINCTRTALTNESLALLPPDNVVVEIQKSVVADEDTISSCQRLKKQGFLLALDNFGLADHREGLVSYADFFKVDFRSMPAAQAAAFVARYAVENRQMLALRVETREHFVVARQHGFTLFQGYFFRRPENIRMRELPANQASHVRLLSAVSKSQVDLCEIENLIKHEPALCYRLLRYLNSPMLGLSSQVTSVRHAVSLLGERELVRWIRTVTALVMGNEKSSDLVLSALVRAYFCELIGAKVEHGRSDLFLMGMLSLMDAILAVPIGVVIEQLSLDATIKEQLLCAKTGGATSLSPIYDLMIAQEQGNWEQVTRLGKRLNLSLYFIAESSSRAMRWAHGITAAAKC